MRLIRDKKTVYHRRKVSLHPKIADDYEEVIIAIIGCICCGCIFCFVSERGDCPRTYVELLQLFEYSMTSSGKSLFSRVMGIDCYFTQSEEHTSASGSAYRNYYVHSLSKDGTVIYQDSTWTGDWASRTVTVAVSEFIANTDRHDSYTGLSNPLVEWNNTDRLVVDNLVDNENAVRVLRAEAATSDGHLSIDTAPHFRLINN